MGTEHPMGTMANPHELLRATKAIGAIDRMPAPTEAIEMQDNAGGPELWRLQYAQHLAGAIEQVHDPNDPMGQMFFNILATFAEFEVDLLRMRTGEGMAVARAKSPLRGHQPKLSDKQRTELRRMHGTGEYTIADLRELFGVSRPTVYRTLQRDNTTTRSATATNG